jgi:hypothetical protein
MQLRQGRRSAAIAAGTAAALGSAFMASVFTGAGPALGAAAGHSIVRVSVSTHGAQADGNSFPTAITPDGRYVLFGSTAGNLVAGDAADSAGLFLRDTRTGVTRLVPVGYRGARPNADLDTAGISADGRYVVFDSSASNLVAHDTNDKSDVFLYDRKRHVTKRISVGLSGKPSSGGGMTPSISANGQRIAFASRATDLVRKDTNSSVDVFVWNKATGKIIRVSVGPKGVQSAPRPPGPPPPYGQTRDSTDPIISGNGRSVTFSSEAVNLVANDVNANVSDIFVHDLDTHVTSLVSVNSQGQQATGGYRFVGSYQPTSISADGQVITFASQSNDLVKDTRTHISDEYVRNRRTGVTQLVEKTLDGSPSAGGAEQSAVSPDGRFVAFASFDSNIVRGDTAGNEDVFLRDLKTNVTRRISVGRKGAEANGESFGAMLSSKAAVVGFDSLATNLVRGDTNGAYDVFLRR